MANPLAPDGHLRRRLTPRLCFLLVLAPFVSSLCDADEEAPRLGDPEIVLARGIINDLARAKSFPAARGLCIDGWKRLAILGDGVALAGLQREVTVDGKHAFSAQDALLRVLGRPESQRLLDLAAAPNRSLAVRAHSLILCSDFAQSRLTDLPPQLNDLLFEIITTGTSEERLRAIQILSRYPCSVGIGQFVQSYLETCLSSNIAPAALPADVCYVDAAVKALEKSPLRAAQKSRDVLRNILRNAPWSEVQRAAARALATAGAGDEARDYFNSAYSNEVDPAVRVRIIGDLARLGDDSRLPLVRESLSSPVETVRHAAYFVCLDRGDDTCIEPALREAMRSDENAEYPLGKFDVLGVADMLASSNTNASVKETAQKFLAALYEKGHVESLRNQALGALLSCDNTYLHTVLDDCLRGVDAPIPAPPPKEDKSERARSEAYKRNVAEAIVIMRLGNKDQQEKALARLQSLYEAALGHTKFNVIFAVRYGRCSYPGVIPFLARVIENPPEEGGDSTRLLAAVSILSIAANCYDG